MLAQLYHGGGPTEIESYDANEMFGPFELAQDEEDEEEEWECQDYGTDDSC